MMFCGFITAMRTLTILPMPGKDAARMANALYYFPLVGALIGGLVTLVVWFLGGVLAWPVGAGVAGVLMSSWVTRGLHLDGLSDTVDGYYGAPTRERRLEIMKDHHVGAFGVVAIVLVLLMKFAALAQLAIYGQWVWIPVPFILARLIQVLLAVTLPYARNEGGTAEAFVKQAGASHFIVAGTSALVLCGLLIQLSGLALFVFTFIIGYLLAQWMKRAFGGVTGDLLGFSNELIECILLFAIAAIMPCLENGFPGLME
ncbi:MAG: adenosylcobinamide-GDP ribazoletransferase [Verrucomicrobia bacterium]|nr:adenosylcobinamide-GDP ribazoletransferase [Verrucomicrobiota bacterium]MBU1735594.1 adenosylcobinamide-GDP ribazoletransferase [Verrucomicrobiota bacterium]MBU1856704.1 adenosylcobinamide-GDP ribazoletransferase [Verrucomicrobiota bacterium]